VRTPGILIVRILLVDDSVRIRSMIQSLLKREIHDLEEIRECTSCEEALALYSAVSPDWVLMDIKLPGMNGLEGTRCLTSEHPGANIVIVTQYDEPAYRDEARMVGARGYVLKDRLEELPGMLRAKQQVNSPAHRND
jgi:DNA-binding NarL/FixJ family response regulator